MNLETYVTHITSDSDDLRAIISKKTVDINYFVTKPIRLFQTVHSPPKRL